MTAVEPRKRLSKLHILMPAAVALTVVAIEWLGSGAVPSPANAADWVAAGHGPPTFAAEVSASEAQLALGLERVANGPDQWLRHESRARALMKRAALSASYDEMAEAREVVATARDLAPVNSGPHLSDASLSMMTHRLGDTQRALVRLEKAAVLEPAELAEAVALAGDVQFYRGNMAAAAERYRELEKIAGASAAAFRRATVAKAAGRFDEAIALLRASEPAPARSTPLQRGRLALQIGGVEMARGDYAAARVWFERANRQFPGYWLFEAHVAQARALDGDLLGAIVDLRRLARRTGSAEVMDTLAIYLREAGAASESRSWAERSSAIWSRRLQQLPEAAYGHAFEHELAFGTRDRLLELAQLNVQARPYGEARVVLAEALLENGRPTEAMLELDRAAKSGWRSAPMYLLRADALEMLGQTGQAAAARLAARQLNPHFGDARTVLIRFSHP